MMRLLKARIPIVAAVVTPTTEIPINVLTGSFMLIKDRKENVPGIMWIHGGGYILGIKEMIYASRAIDLVKNYGAIVISLGYHLALFHLILRQ